MSSHQPHQAPRTQLVGAELAAARLSDSNHPGAVAAWRACLRVADRSGSIDAMAMASYHLYWAEADRTNLSRLQRAAAMGSESAWALRATALMSMLDGDFVRAAEHDARALELATIDPLARAMCLDKLAIAHAIDGSFDAAIAMSTRARHGYVELELMSAATTAALTLADVLADAARPRDQLATCRAALSVLSVDAPRHLRIATEGMLAHALMSIGETGAAAQHATSAVQLIELNSRATPYDAAAIVVHARVALELHAPCAAQSLRLARERVDELGFRSFVDEVTFDELRASHTFHPNTDLFSEPVVAARYALWAARNGHAPDISSDLSSSDASASDFISRCYAEIRAHQPTADPSDIDDAATDWLDAGYRIEAARCAVVGGVTAARRGDHETATARTRTGLRLLAASGLVGEVAEAQRSARKLGIDVRVKFDGAGDVLTPREFEVARHAAAGRGNAEVATELDLALGTVEKALATAYRKLGVTSRSNLGQALDHALGVA